MKFLDAKNVEMVWYSEDKEYKTKIISEDGRELVATFNFKLAPEYIIADAIVIEFDSVHKAPLKINLGVNRYIMEPFDLEAKLYKADEQEPYHTVKLEELSTRIELRPETVKIAISCTKANCNGKEAKVRFHLNYSSY